MTDHLAAGSRTTDARAKKQILVVEPSYRESVRMYDALSKAGHQVVVLPNAFPAAIEVARGYDVVLFDADLDDLQGLLSTVGLLPKRPLMVLTTRRWTLGEAASQSEAHVLLRKPIRADQLLAVVDSEAA